MTRYGYSRAELPYETGENQRTDRMDLLLRSGRVFFSITCNIRKKVKYLPNPQPSRRGPEPRHSHHEAD